MSPFCSVLFNVNFTCFCQSGWSLVIVSLLIQSSYLFYSDLTWHCLVQRRPVASRREGTWRMLNLLAQRWWYTDIKAVVTGVISVALCAQVLLLSQDYGKHLLGVEDLLQKHALVEADIAIQAERVRGVNASVQKFATDGEGKNGLFQIISWQWSTNLVCGNRTCKLLHHCRFLGGILHPGYNVCSTMFCFVFLILGTVSFSEIDTISLNTQMLLGFENLGF